MTLGTNARGDGGPGSHTALATSLVTCSTITPDGAPGNGGWQDDHVPAKDLVYRYGTRLHKVLYTATGGKLFHRGRGMPMVKLTTIGRRTGQPRTIMATTPLVMGDSLVLVASFGGDDREPQWCLNIRANPEVEVTLGAPPGTSEAEYLKDLDKTWATRPARLDTPLYRAIETAAAQTYPGATFAPALFEAGTSLGPWREHDIPGYGVYPYVIDNAQLVPMHGNDEKVSIESLKLGTEMIYNVLVEVAGRR